MDVLAERPETRVAVPAANGEDRELAVELEQLLRQLGIRERRRLVTRRWPLPS